jgi:hypothetical protein
VKNPKVQVGVGGASSAGWHKAEKAFYCSKEYQLSVVRGLHSPVDQTPDYFAIGSLFTAMRARWFARGFRDTTKTWKALQKAMEDEILLQKEPVSFNARRMATTYMREYMNHWKVRPHPTPIACEHLLGPVALGLGDSKFIARTAKLDDISRYPEAAGQLCIGEAKTTSGTVQDVINQYQVHGQTMLQYLTWKLAPQGEALHGPVAGTILDIIVKGYGGKPSKFARHFIPFEPRAIAWFKEALRYRLKEAEKIDWNTEGPWMRNPAMCTRAGTRGRVPCEFRDLCQFGPAAAGKYVLADGKPLSSFKPDKERKSLPWE